MTNNEIAEFATRIVESVSKSPNLQWKVDSLCALYEHIFDTIKKKDQEN